MITYRQLIALGFEREQIYRDAFSRIGNKYFRKRVKMTFPNGCVINVNRKMVIVSTSTHRELKHLRIDVINNASASIKDFKHLIEKVKLLDENL